jgi:DUF4097 and DUF4098 domain-containing protein YvlB
MIRPFLLVLASAAVWAQTAPEKVTVPLSDPGRPVTLEVEQVSGSIIVKAYAGKEITVEAVTRPGGERKGREGREGREGRPATEGLKRIDAASTNLSVEEKGNRVKIETESWRRPTDLTIMVPVETSVKLETVNSGEIHVEGIRGTIEVENTNGKVTLVNVSGSVTAETVNGSIIASLGQVAPDRPMAFTTVNGSIDVTLPPDIKARVKLMSENGEVFSDFDIAMEASKAATQVSDDRGKGGKYRIKLEKAIYGNINGGGPEYRFNTLNGGIYIRKKK